jgi:hypothetical protein
MNKIGNAHGPEQSWSAMSVAFRALIPPAPMLRPAVVPAPPLITADMSKRKSLRLVALGFRSALTHLRGGAGRMLIEVESRDPDALLHSKYLTTLLGAIPSLIEHKIPPAAWTAFSIMVWDRYIVNGEGAWNATPSKLRRPKSTMPPNPSWVFAEKRLQNRVDWFLWHEAHYRGGRMKISDKHRRLIRRYEQLKRELLSLRDPSADDVRFVVSSRLSHQEIERLTKAAQDEYDFAQEELNARALGGEWLW